MRKRFLALVAINCVSTVFTRHCHVDYRRPGVLDRLPKVFQIFWIGRREVAGPRLDLVDIELFDHMGSKVFEINGGIATLMVVSRDKLPEGIGGDGNSLARFRWKPDRRAGGWRCSQQGGGK